MRVLLFGGGAREHSLAYKLLLSTELSKLFLCVPNDGFAHLGEVLPFKNYKQIALLAKQKQVDLLVVGPEVPLADGIVDEFKKVGISAIGPDKNWARLESSKSFAKEFMINNDIPTAQFKIITDISEINMLDDFSLPVVIKADGLAAGKGVYIANTRDDAENVINDFLNGKYGNSSKKIVIEEFLEGDEISLISIWDGKSLLPFTPARDYKKLLEGNQGPNTGGMGAYCPVILNDRENIEIKDYLKNLETALLKEKADFVGVVYSGLILTKSGVKVLEYNLRFGDPETQALMIHLKTDLLYIFEKAIKHQLDSVKLEWNDGYSTCLVIASDGYPFSPKKNCKLENVDELQEKFDVKIFYAGVKNSGDELVSNGGRVLSVCKTNAIVDIYAFAKELDFNDKYYRNDIGAAINEGIINYSRI